MSRACNFAQLLFRRIVLSSASRFFMRFFLIAASAALLASTFSVETRAQTAVASPPPTFVLGKGTPVSIEDADRILRARMPGAAAPSAGAQAAVISQQALTTSPATSCGSGSSQPVEITTLAASLKCDVDLIFEYVYNNIEYEPLFGSNKGALGTLLDQR